MEKEKLKEIANFIRNNSSKGNFTKYEDLCLEPVNLPQEAVNEALEELKADDEYKDIIERQGKERKYLYCSTKMSENYANIVFRVEEQELLRLLVDTVRYESRIYPRPTTVSLFTEKPFDFNKSQIEDFLKLVAENEEYIDIQKTMASNGAIYLYSTKYMTKDHAEALTEWIEVLQQQNP